VQLHLPGALPGFAWLFFLGGNRKDGIPCIKKSILGVSLEKKEK